MKEALINVNVSILSTLEKLRSANKIISLISNADSIDCKYWNQSPLSNLFDYTVFSCDVGLMKPDIRIYEYVMDGLNATASECIYVGDGGSNELDGARKAGMQTVFTEFLVRKDNIKRHKLIMDSDFHIVNFEELFDIVQGI